LCCVYARCGDEDAGRQQQQDSLTTDKECGCGGGDMWKSSVYTMYREDQCRIG
jgi:hypothetical protein